MASEHIFRGPEMDIIPSCSFVDNLLPEMIKFGSRTAMIDGLSGGIVTHADLLQLCDIATRNLTSRGLRRGDRIAICSENSVMYPVPVISAFKIGVVVASLNPIYTDRELEHCLSLTKPRLLVGSAFTAPMLRKVAKKAPGGPDVVTIEELCQVMSPLPASPAPPQSLSCPNSDDLALLLFSSGTTGLPKAVMITHRNLVATQYTYMDNVFNIFDDESRFLGLIPFFHAFGMCTLLLGLMKGCVIVVIPKFEPELFLRSIQNYKINMLFVVPPLMVFLAKHPMVDDYNLKSIERFTCGAAPLSAEIENAVSKRLGVKEIHQGYGMTECTLALTSMPRNCHKVGSVGILLPGVEAKVIDVTTGRSLGPEKEGEMLFRSPTIMKGYLGNAEATASTVDNEGWLHTGDIGYYDKDGYFFIVDRLKELIKYKGFQVPPAELEALLLTHPKVADAAVIGIPDESSGELPLAFVVPQSGAKPTQKELQDFVAGQVSAQKRLRGGVKFVDSIPKNPSGKILRRELRERIKKSKL